MGDKCYIRNYMSLALVATLCSTVGFVLGWLAAQYALANNDKSGATRVTNSHESVGLIEKRIIQDKSMQEIVPYNLRHLNLNEHISETSLAVTNQKTTSRTEKPSDFGERRCPGLHFTNHQRCPMRCTGPSSFYKMISGMSWYIAYNNVTDSLSTGFRVPHYRQNTNRKCQSLCLRDSFCYAAVFEPQSRKCWPFYTWEPVDYDGRNWCSRKYNPGNGTVVHSSLAIRSERMCDCSAVNSAEDFFLISLNRHSMCSSQSQCSSTQLQCTLAEYEQIQC